VPTSTPSITKEKTPLHLSLTAASNELTTGNITKFSIFKEIVFHLVASGATTNCTDLSGVAPIHLAAEMGDKDLVQCLVEEGGAFVGITDSENETALFYALRGRHQKVVEQLINEYQIDINWKNDDGESSLDVMKAIGDDKMVDVLTALGGAAEEEAEEPGERKSRWGGGEKESDKKGCSLSGCNFSWGLVRSVSTGTAC